ncbi:aminomethyltransferase family protein [Geminicoccus roseus]|uniref:hypothetical protein n=1 Tax=Geminicoccus roseus TaxID=404900 RepID=UPI000409BF96|nr:hypothetical protein [Geminicoccus roseus]
MAETKLAPLGPIEAFGLAPVPAVSGLRVGIAPVRVAVGLAGTHGAPGLALALAGLLGHAPDPAPGSCTGADPCSIWTGPDRWLVTSDQAQRFELVRAVQQAAPRSVLVTDVTDGLPAIELAGPGARRLLAHGCPAEIADGRSARTLLALQPVTLVARGETVRVFTDRSLVPFLWDWIGRHAPLAAAG